MAEPNAVLEAETGEEGEGGIDLKQVKEALGFLWRARLRRPKLFWTTFTTVATLGLAAAAALPSVYTAETKLLAHNDLVLPALINPYRVVPRDADDPIKNVAQMVLRKENLIALAKDADLVDRFAATRPPALRLKDRFVAWLRGPVSERDMLRGMVGTLEKKITVASDESTLMFSVDWSEPEMAYDLVTLLEKNFLEARYDSSVAVIADAISMLQEHAKTELQEVDQDLAEYQKQWAARFPDSATIPRSSSAAPRAVRLAARQTAVGAAATASGAAGPSDAALALDQKRQQIRALEAEHQRQLDAVQQQLSQAQLTLTPLHPTVVALKQKLDALAQPSPELAQMKLDERALMAQIVPLAPVAPLPPLSTAPLTAPEGGAAKEPAQAASAPPPAGTKGAEEDPATGFTHSKLDTAVHQYEDIMARIDSANIELDITRTAFKYRYTVITPAEVPTKPKKPMAQYIALGAIPVGGLLALLLAAMIDLFGGRILEKWQIRRTLKLEVLGELQLPGG